MNYVLMVLVLTSLHPAAFAQATSTTTESNTQTNTSSSTATETSQSVQAAATLLGQTLNVVDEAAVLASATGLSTSTVVQFLGNLKTLLEASTQYVSTTPNATLYVAGMRVWNGAMTQSGGSYGYTGGIAPTQFSIPVASYPVGPLVLGINAGVIVQAQLAAKLTPGLSYPLAYSDLNVSLSATASGSAFVEGSASLLIIKVGVGGNVQVIDGTTALNAFLFEQAPPQLTYSGTVTLLSGHVYGFADNYKLFGGWNQFWSQDFFKWSGKCYAFGSSKC